MGELEVILSSIDKTNAADGLALGPEDQTMISTESVKITSMEKEGTALFFTRIMNCPRRQHNANKKRYNRIVRSWDIISYPLFADADTGIYPHTALQYHARPKAKRGIAMLSVDKFPYPRNKQGVTNLSHAQTIFVTFWNVSAALKSQLSH